MKTGYKATYDFICLDHKFEIGQTYELQGTPIPCEYGFHYCVNSKDVLKYYIIKRDFRVIFDYWKLKILENQSLKKIKL
jgi:hypothetical protein